MEESTLSSLMDSVGWVEVGWVVIDLVEFIQSTKLGIVGTWAGLGRAELVLVVGVILLFLMTMSRSRKISCILAARRKAG